MSCLSNITAVIVLDDVTEVIFDCLDNLKNIKIIIVDNGKNNLNISSQTIQLMQFLINWK